MDQKVLAGIGNIYADEILYRARHPPRARRRGHSRRRRSARLHRAIGEVLATAIALEGSSFDAGYRTVLGLEGGFLAQNSVYGARRSALPACERRSIRRGSPGSSAGRPITARLASRPGAGTQPSSSSPIHIDERG